MSGICGMCELGAPLRKELLLPMLSATALPEDAVGEPAGRTGVLMGAASRWTGQEVAAIPGVILALDADLLHTDTWAARLENGGLNCSSMTLAERVARLYLLRGMDFLNDLDGSFSLALWDEKARRLILAIDRMGIGSLHWRAEGDRLLFATRAGAICAAQRDPVEANPVALMQYLLFSVVPAPLGAYRGQEKLRPGHWLAFEDGRVTQHCYWDVDYREQRVTDERHWIGELREGIRSAVHRHLDGCAAESVGAYLSGGTDSSSVVAFLSERFSPANSYSIFFREDAYSEIGYARIAAEKFRTRHHEYCLKPGDAFSAVQAVIRHYDEPFANSSAIGAYYCARLARETGVSTLLAGDGGDEVFAGNERYASDRPFALYHALPRWLRSGLVEPFVKLLPENGGPLSLPRRYVRRASIPNPRRLFSYGLYLTLRPEEVFEPGFLEQAPPEHWMAVADAHYAAPQNTSELNRQMYLDLKLILADNDLRKVSGTAEISGVRVRYPLLDRRLVELTASIPSGLKMKGFKKRYIFKKAMQGILPEHVLNKKKHGFGVPLSQWFLQDAQLRTLLEDVLFDSRTRQRGYFRPAFLDRLAQLHREDHTAYYGEAIWYVVALELWHRQHLESWKASFCDR